MAIKKASRKKVSHRKKLKNRVPVQSGNIDLKKRKAYKNKGGSVSTIKTIGIGEGNLETVIPTIGPKGRRMKNKQAIKHYKKTGKHLGKFRTRGAAADFARETSASQGLRQRRKKKK